MKCYAVKGRSESWNALDESFCLASTIIFCLVFHSCPSRFALCLNYFVFYFFSFVLFLSFLCTSKLNDGLASAAGRRGLRNPSVRRLLWLKDGMKSEASHEGRERALRFILFPFSFLPARNKKTKEIAGSSLSKRE